MYYHRPGVKTWCPMRRAAFAAGFQNYVETSQPVKDLPPISEIIRGNKSSDERPVTSDQKAAVK